MNPKFNPPVAINVVIEGQLLILLNVTFCENSHPNMLSNRPLGDVAIGTTAMIGEAPDPSALRCVDKLWGIGRQMIPGARLNAPHPSAAS